MESVMEDLLVERGERNGWYSRKLNFTGRRGAPDRLFIRRGRVVFIEVKQPGEPTSPNQDREIKALRDAGAEVYVVDNLKDGYRILDAPD